MKLDKPTFRIDRITTKAESRKARTLARSYQDKVEKGLSHKRIKLKR